MYTILSDLPTFPYPHRRLKSLPTCQKLIQYLDMMMVRSRDTVLGNPGGPTIENALHGESAVLCGNEIETGIGIGTVIGTGIVIGTGTGTARGTERDAARRRRAIAMCQTIHRDELGLEAETATAGRAMAARDGDEIAAAAAFGVL